MFMEVKIKTVVTFVGGLIFFTLVHGEITPSTFYNACDPGSTCFFLNHLQTTRNLFELSNDPKSCHENSFCMRVDMKPTGNDPCQHHFELGAIGIESDKEYIAIALSLDGQMNHDYAFYCRNGAAYAGLINRRDDKSGVFRTTEHWKPDPFIRKDLNEFQLSKKFMRCGLTTKIVHHAKKYFFHLRLGSGPKNVSQPWWLHMVHGNKTSLNSTDLLLEDRHREVGYTSEALKHLVASTPGACNSENTIHGKINSVTSLCFLILCFLVEY